MNLLDYELKHINYLEKNAAECTLFLKKNNEFPLSGPCTIALIGNGARNTIKGGTGSGDIVSHFFLSCEAALKEKGFNIVSSDWMDKYDEFKKSTRKDFIKYVKVLAKKANTPAYIYSMGFFEEEKDYAISCNYDAEACVYVLARNSGEGNNRRNIKGDVKLTDKEVSDILFLNKKFKKFMLVLNVGGVVDLSPVLEVSNILLLSQLGAVTGSVFAEILLGQYNPSGKLATTWTKPEDYPGFCDFGFMHDTYYKEGIYVGYKYFSSVSKNVYFPFGFGLSYTDFELNSPSASVNKMSINAKINVKNIGNFSGKEVVQVYLSKPNTLLEQPKIELCGYKKSKVLEPNEEELLNIEINLLDFASYDDKNASWILPKGDYIIRIGNSSINNKPILKAVLDETLILDKLENKLINQTIKELSIKPDNEDIKNIKTSKLDYSDVKSKKVTYKKDTYVDHFIGTLANEDLASICLGNYGKGFAAIVGGSCVDVIGGAGQTALSVKAIDKSLTMADGPAGLRVKYEYGVDNKGIYDTKLEPFMENMLNYLPIISAPFIKPPKNRHGNIHHQYTTAIPIGTALAQSFNNQFVRECGQIINKEMDIFGIDLWLAPALNLQRNILCGRNFEYYSEDSYLTGSIAIAMIQGVESGNNKGVTIKHFACNNQEWNRTNNNSCLSERALRETYLKGFQMCITKTQPKAIMTSYNLINGVHASESYELINDILRCEWGYEGLVMTDWVQTGRKWSKISKYPSIYASNNILSGNDLTMPGYSIDYKDIIKALKSGKMSRDDLLFSASRIYRSILKQKG